MTEQPTLASLDAQPYLDEQGEISSQFQGKVGVYAIFDAEKTLQFIGYSRDIALSLLQHLVRQPGACYWVKVKTSDRPNRTELEAIRDAWIAENGTVPPGNAQAQSLWTQAIDVKQLMTAEEQAVYAAAIDELAQIKALKQAARRIESDVLQQLQQRGLTTQIRFNPKLKETGLLDLK